MRKAKQNKRLHVPARDDLGLFTALWMGLFTTALATPTNTSSTIPKDVLRAERRIYSENPHIKVARGIAVSDCKYPSSIEIYVNKDTTDTVGLRGILPGLPQTYSVSIVNRECTDMVPDYIIIGETPTDSPWRYIVQASNVNTRFEKDGAKISNDYSDNGQTFTYVTGKFSTIIERVKIAYDEEFAAETQK